MRHNLKKIIDFMPFYAEDEFKDINVAHLLVGLEAYDDNDDDDDNDNDNDDDYDDTISSCKLVAGE